MGRLFVESLEGNVYSCKHCKTHFAIADDIVSKWRSIVRFSLPQLEKNSLGIRLCTSYPSHIVLFKQDKLDDITVFWRGSREAFHCRHGKAYLFRDVVNVTFGEKEERMMITGMHIVADIYCVCCGSIVGWKYESAYEKSQKYKEGKFILERFKVLGPDGSTYQGIPASQFAESDADEE